MSNHQHQITANESSCCEKDAMVTQSKIMDLGRAVSTNYQWLEREVLRCFVDSSMQEQHANFAKKNMVGLEHGQLPASVLVALSRAEKLHIARKLFSIEVS